MKKIKFRLFATIFVCGILVTLTACSNDNDNDTTPDSSYLNPLPKAEYTILYYAQGGGDLDFALMTNINHFYKGLSGIDANKVHVAIQYKASTYENLKKLYSLAPDVTESESETASKELGGTTFRMVANGNSKSFMDNLQVLGEKSILGQSNSNADVTNPDSLANFIKWATRMAPADKYILIMSSHGSGYLAHEDFFQPVTRGIIFDDGYDNNHFFRLPDIINALESSGVKMSAICLDACMMNTMEYQFELQSLTDYLALSSFSVPGDGGQYDVLVNQLATNNNLESALTEYVKQTVTYWSTQKDTSPFHDMTLTRTANLPAFGAKLKEFTDKLIDAYKNGGDEVKKAIDAATKKAYKIEKMRPLYDIYDYYHIVAQAAPAYFSQSFVKELDDAFNSTIVYQQFSSYLTTLGYKVEATVTMGAKNYYTLYFWQKDASNNWVLPEEGIAHYMADGTRMIFSSTTGEYLGADRWASDFNHSYKMTKFDKLTGWSRWIELNEQEPNESCAAGWGV